MLIVEYYKIYNRYTQMEFSPTYYALCFILKLLERAAIPPRIYISMLIKLTTLKCDQMVALLCVRQMFFERKAFQHITLN